MPIGLLQPDDGDACRELLEAPGGIEPPNKGLAGLHSVALSSSVFNELVKAPPDPSGFGPVGSTAPVQSKPTAQAIRRVSAALAIRQADQQGLTLGFNARPFVLCALPIRRPPPGTLKHVRRNGKYTLEVIGHPDYGLPHGQDRLIPIGVATTAVRNRSRTVEFRSGREILDAFGLAPDGPHYRRLLDGFRRVFCSTIFFGTDLARKSASLWAQERIHFFDSITVWTGRRSQSSTRPLSITLSEAFWTELQHHPVPVDMATIKEFSNNPGCLDFYMWLCWRCFLADRSMVINLFDASGLVRNSAFYSTPGRGTSENGSENG